MGKTSASKYGFRSEEELSGANLLGTSSMETVKQE